MDSYKVVTWYDNRLRLWGAAYHDSNDMQIGHAEFGPTKELAEQWLRMDKPEDRK